MSRPGVHTLHSTRSDSTLRADTQTRTHARTHTQTHTQHTQAVALADMPAQCMFAKGDGICGCRDDPQPFCTLFKIASSSGTRSQLIEGVMRSPSEIQARKKTILETWVTLVFSLFLPLTSACASLFSTRSRLFSSSRCRDAAHSLSLCGRGRLRP